MVGRVNAGMPAAFLHYWLAMARPTWVLATSLHSSTINFTADKHDPGPRALDSRLPKAPTRAPRSRTQAGFEVNQPAGDRELA